MRRCPLLSICFLETVYLPDVRQRVSRDWRPMSRLHCIGEHCLEDYRRYSVKRGIELFPRPISRFHLAPGHGEEFWPLSSPTIETVCQTARRRETECYSQRACARWKRAR